MDFTYLILVRYNVQATFIIYLLLIGRYVMGRPAFIPATPLGVLEILKRCKVDTFGKTACIVGRSKHIGTADCSLSSKIGNLPYLPYKGVTAT